MDSLKRRYAYKVLTNFVGMAIAGVTQVLVPRGLGPAAYGDFNFLSNFFTQFVTFLDTGTSLGFYTKLSQRPRDQGLVLFYLYFSGVVGAVVLIATGFVLKTRFGATIWPGQSAPFVLMGALFGIALWLTQVLNRMTDAYGITVSSELARIFQKVLAFCLLATLFWLGWLNLGTYFAYQFVVLAVLGAAFVFVIHRHGFSLGRWWMPAKALREYGGEFYEYSHPLFVYATVVSLAGIADRWMLQRYGGSTQQGYFGLSFQVSAICLLFTNAMTPLLMRELSISFGTGDIEGMARLFKRYVPALVSIAAYFSCFLALQYDKIALFAGGQQFRQAGAAVALMSLFPIPATYGQLSGSVFYATNQTRLYRDVGTISAVCGLMLTYVLVAPRSAWGLGAGATGLALKLLIHTFLTVNILLYFNLKYMKLRFRTFFVHQIVAVSVLLALAKCASTAADRLIPNMIVNFLAAGFCYTLLVAAALFTVPSVFGLEREQLSSIVAQARRKLTA